MVETESSLFPEAADPGRGPGPVGYATVAPEQGIDLAAGGLTYAVPPWLSDLAVGERVTVPLGKADKPVPGYVVERQRDCPLPADQQRRVKPIRDRDHRGVALPADLVALAQWMAGYYCCPLGMVFGTMLPAAVKRGTGVVMETQVRVVVSGQSSAVSGQRSVVGRKSLEQDVAGGDVSGESAKTPPPPESRGRQPGAKRLSGLQKQVLSEAEALAEAGRPWVTMKVLADRAGAKTVSPVKQLIEKGLLEPRRVERIVSDLDLRAERSAAAGAERVTLTDAQRQAVNHLAEHVGQGFGVHLLHGVTGSGKTEVYLRMIERVMEKPSAVSDQPSAVSDQSCTADQPSVAADELKEARSSTGAPPPGTEAPKPGIIVLVPEIALTPQTVARFLARFEGVAVLHSGLTAAQRNAQWRRIHRGEARIVVGARSAIFAPLSNLSLVIVDEEHESSYKQDQLPRYHGRDVAIKRAQMWGAAIVLGSATPSLESYYNAGGGRWHAPDDAASSDGDGTSVAGEAGTSPAAPGRSPETGARYHLLRLPERVAGWQMPSVELVDMQAERRSRRGIHMLSQRLERLLGEVLYQPGGQAILLLNRRGYANYIACPDHRCGWLLRCDHCDAAMVYHKDRHLPTGGLVRCHHCTAEQRLPNLCPTCGKKLTVFGHGTQRVEEELERKFPGISYLRMDADTMRTGRDYETTLARFREGEARVLLGTQMIAKGLDFGGVRLVGVISGDTALHLPDFRASERTQQLIAQVSGRAGRSDNPGRVVVQTISPDDPAITAAAGHDYEGFAARELKLRAEMGLPPIYRLARIVVRDLDHARCFERGQKLAEALQQYDRQLGTQVMVRGPMPCPLARIADYYRHQIELLAAAPGAIQKLLTALRNARLLISDAHTAVDVDPVALL